MPQDMHLDIVSVIFIQETTMAIHKIVIQMELPEVNIIYCCQMDVCKMYDIPPMKKDFMQMLVMNRCTNFHKIIFCVGIYFVWVFV